jgi:putative transposase
VRLGIGEFRLGFESLGDDLVGCPAIEHALTAAIVGSIEAAQELLQGTVGIDVDSQYLATNAAVEAFDHPVVASHEAVRAWEAKLLPVMGDELRKRRHGSHRQSGRSWYVDETYLKVRGRWCYLYRAIDRDGNLVDTMLSATRDMAAAKAFFRSARATMGFRPDRVTTDGHGSYPRAIRSILGKRVRHRTCAYLNNRLEQDHRGIKGRIRCMRGFKDHDAAARFCRGHGELRDLLRSRRHHNQSISASSRRSRFCKGAQIALNIMQNA